MRKDLNKELFILFENEAATDNAVEVLTKCSHFTGENADKIKVGYATDNVLELVLKNVIIQAQQ